MKEKTMQECLAMQTKYELEDVILRLGLTPMKKSAKKAELTAYIEQMLPQYAENLRLQMRLKEIDAVNARLEKSLDIPHDVQAKDAEDLLPGLLVLQRYGLVWRNGKTWRVRPQVQEMLRISDEERAEQRMHDMLAAVMDGWLMHVGMMPLQELLHRTAMLLEPEPEEITDVEQLCFAILIARMGPGAIYVDEEDAAWAVSEELEDPDALWKRLQEPHIATLPYPDFCVEDLLFSALETLLPGDIELYGPLLDWLEAHEAEDIDDLLNELVWLCQNTRERETPECLLSCVKTKDIDDANNGVRAMYGLFNALPHWSNKGHSPNELIERTRGQRKAPAMPGRNDRCPCGSGKKYKQCCGRLMN